MVGAKVGVVYVAKLVEVVNVVEKAEGTEV